MEELPIETKRGIIAQQIAGYAQNIYLSELAHKINKRLGNTDKTDAIEKDLTRLHMERDLWVAELEALK